MTVGGAPEHPWPPSELDRDLLGLLRVVAEAIADVLSEGVSWSPAPGHPGQHVGDVVADGIAVQLLGGAGLALLSEESGERPPSGVPSAPEAGRFPPGLLAVVDPVDGSTNAAHGLPFYATSLAILDATGVRVGLVQNLASGLRYEAVRGHGARRAGAPLAPVGPVPPAAAVVACNGWPAHPLGVAQLRMLGSAALELCAVADGTLDGYVDASAAGLAPWDYLAALLVCREVGVLVAEREGAELEVVDAAARRRPVAAVSSVLLDALRTNVAGA